MYGHDPHSGHDIRILTRRCCSIEGFDKDYFELPDDIEQPEEIREDRPKKKKKKKKRSALRIFAILLCIVLFCELLYCFVVFTDIGAIKSLREDFIGTALETNSHRWIADYFLPKYMVDSVSAKIQYIKNSQVGVNSERPTPSEPTAPTETSELPTESTEETEPNVNAAEEAFYELFWELNRSSFEDYLDEHPDVLANGWENIYINEAGLYDEGTTIYTSQGEQVLAVDAKNQILLVRVTGTGYLGVLAICKDPSQLRCEASEGIGRYGQTMGEIVEGSGGVIGMTGSGFFDPEGGGNGGILAGYTMCEGVGYGVHYDKPGYKRIELATDNRFYICDSNTETTPDTTDAVEFSPALIIDGELMVGGFYDWNGINPRAAIGQSERGEILMLVIEGRQVGRSIGTDVETCAHILKRHEGYTAMSVDGGTSAVMYYDGEYVTRCSNLNISSRLLPNAWVYGNYDE